MMQDHTGEKAQKTANCDQNVTAVAAAVNGPVVLVGMMGTGKSQLGRMLAKTMDLPFIDSDTEFETASGCTISDYFSRYGEDAFRQGEYKVMDRLLDGQPKIIAAGGGIVVLPETRAILKDRATTVWLQASVDTLVERTAANNKRPLLQNGDPAAILNALLEKRSPLYEEVAVFSVSTDCAVGDEALNTILKGLATCPKT